MDKEKNIAEEIKTKDDIKKFFRRMIEDKQAVADCIRAGRPLSDLKDRGIKIAKLTDVSVNCCPADAIFFSPYQ